MILGFLLIIIPLITSNIYLYLEIQKLKEKITNLEEKRIKKIKEEEIYSIKRISESQEEKIIPLQESNTTKEFINNLKEFRQNLNRK